MIDWERWRQPHEIRKTLLINQHDDDDHGGDVDDDGGDDGDVDDDGGHGGDVGD